MNADFIIIAVPVILGLITVAVVVARRRPRKLNPEVCQSRWRELQKYCSDRKTWHKAVTDADKLLDDVLKRRRYKGKSPGERLVSAQHDFSNNESLWFGHKLHNRITQDNLKKLSKQDTLEALSGFRQALKDLGALHEKVTPPPAPIKPSAKAGNAETEASL